MDFSKLGANDRNALIAGIVVAATALLSITGNWGVFMVLSLLAGLAAIFIVLQPQIAPAMRLPAPKGMSLLIAGAVATAATGLTAVDWLGWIVEHFVAFDTLQFVIGLIAAIALLYLGWVAYAAERGAAPSAPPAPPPPPAA